MDSLHTDQSILLFTSDRIVAGHRGASGHMTYSARILFPIFPNGNPPTLALGYSFEPPLSAQNAVREEKYAVLRSSPDLPALYRAVQLGPLMQLPSRGSANNDAISSHLLGLYDAGVSLQTDNLPLVVEGAPPNLGDRVNEILKEKLPVEAINKAIHLVLENNVLLPAQPLLREIQEGTLIHTYNVESAIQRSVCKGHISRGLAEPYHAILLKTDKPNWHLDPALLAAAKKYVSHVGELAKGVAPYFGSLLKEIEVTLKGRPANGISFPEYVLPQLLKHIEEAKDNINMLLQLGNWLEVIPQFRTYHHNLSNLAMHMESISNFGRNTAQEGYPSLAPLASTFLAKLNLATFHYTKDAYRVF